ncbi:MAG: chemotaxis protein CheC [Nitrospirae bacterium]|nr:chemotaxis protein CheC [Nitrospirota bacterium]
MIERFAVSEEHMDYLQEMMNVAAGNAVTAFSQLLECDVDIDMPNVFVLPATEAINVFKTPDVPVVCVRMDLLGDVRGRIFFVIPDDQKANMLALARNALPDPLRKNLSLEINALEEIGNIIVGVFLTAIHDFTRLNICHTVPALVIDQILPMIDASLAAQANKETAGNVLVVECEFQLIGGKLKTVLFMVMGGGAMDALFNSIGTARALIRGE